MRSEFAPNEQDTEAIGASLVSSLQKGDVVLLDGPLGAGKTTLVRGILHALGHGGPVRSPTFNLLQEFATELPVMHADLYRLETARGLGLEEYMDSHVCLIEWPDRLDGLIDPLSCWRVRLEFEGSGRRIEIEPPSA